MSFAENVILNLYRVLIHLGCERSLIREKGEEKENERKHLRMLW